VEFEARLGCDLDWLVIPTFSSRLPGKLRSIFTSSVLIPASLQLVSDEVVSGNQRSQNLAVDEALDTILPSFVKTYPRYLLEDIDTGRWLANLQARFVPEVCGTETF
jgi:hypothetical protein